jgi:hypothetical protein
MIDIPGPSPTAPVQEMSFDQAVSLKAELMGNAEWRDKYYNGDPTARQQMDAIVRGLTPKQGGPGDPSSAEEAIDFLRQRADISDEVAQMIRTRMPISPQERRMTEQLKERLFADKAWVKRYLDGGREEQNTMAMINVNLSAPVRDDPSKGA